jgi:hypothetical protein
MGNMTEQEKTMAQYNHVEDKINEYLKAIYDWNHLPVYNVSKTDLDTLSHVRAMLREIVQYI